MLDIYSKCLTARVIWHTTMRDKVPFERFRPRIKIEQSIDIEQNSLLEVRRKSAQAWNVHRAQTWDGRSVRVRRYKEDAIFEEDRNPTREAGDGDKAASTRSAPDSGDRDGEGDRGD